MSMEFPLVSIIIPTYNRAHMIREALNSVLNQTYKNLEIIVVDDNDPDSKARKDTEKEMLIFSRYSMIKYIRLSKNHGGAIARNKGAEIAKGEFICFLDDDDVYHNDKIQKQVEIFLKSKYHLAVVGAYANILNKEKKIIRIEKNIIKGDVFKYQLQRNICTTSIAMIRKEIFDLVGGFDKMPSSQEHMLFIKIFSINPYYDFVDKVLVDIIHHDGERISTNTKKPLGAIKLLEKVELYFAILSEAEKKEITLSHYENIIRSYMAINDKKNAILYLKKYIKLSKKIDKVLIKLITIIMLGFGNINKLKYR